MTALSSPDRMKADTAAQQPVAATPVSHDPAADGAAADGAADGTGPGRFFPKACFAELLAAKTAALAEAMNRRFALAGVDTSLPVPLDIAPDGHVVVRNSHPDKATIERLFAEDSDFANQYREVAGGNAFLAAGRVSEQFRLELDGAGTGERRKRVYRRFDPIFQQLEQVGGRMTLEGGCLPGCVLSPPDRRVA